MNRHYLHTCAYLLAYTQIMAARICSFDPMRRGGGWISPRTTPESAPNEICSMLVPTGLHALKLDPKIAAGPVTLAFTDIFTLFFYFGMAAWIL